MAPTDADENALLALGGPNLKTPHNGGRNAAFADGHTEFLSEEMRAEKRRALISKTGSDSAEAEAESDLPPGMEPVSKIVLALPTDQPCSLAEA